MSRASVTPAAVALRLPEAELILGLRAGDRRLTSAQRRFTRSVEALARVRNHLAAAVLLASRTARDVTPTRADAPCSKRSAGETRSFATGP